MQTSHAENREAIIGLIQMDCPGDLIPIFKGTFILRSGAKEINVDGEVFFKWIPNTGVHFKGYCDERLNTKEFFENDDIIKLTINDQFFGDCFISTISNKIKYRVAIEGVLISSALLGNTNYAVDKIAFSVPNLQEFLGSHISKIDDTGFRGILGRLHLENEQYIISIDKDLDFSKKYSALGLSGGFCILYSGELRKKNGKLFIKASNEIFDCLNFFLTFINGRRTSAFFRHGINKGATTWIDYSKKYVDTHQGCISWASKNSSNTIMSIWKEFSRLWNFENDKEVLKYVIHWYVEANKDSLITESQLVIGQTALELIYNWFIVETKKVILGEDAKNISATSKIRLLLSFINIDTKIPSSLKELSSLAKDLDGPAIITQIRNQIVHSQFEKRKSLEELTDLAKFEALKLSLWYIELSMLYILKAKGIYYNRCSNKKWSYQNEEPLPWSL